MYDCTIKPLRCQTTALNRQESVHPQGFGRHEVPASESFSSDRPVRVELESSDSVSNITSVEN